MKPYIPTPANPWNAEKAAHLLRRTAIGVKPSEIERAVHEGFAKTIERLFTPYSPPLGFITDWVGKEPDTFPRPEGAVYDAWFWDVMGRRTGFNQWWMQTMVEAPISLGDRMTLFWHGHFTTSFSFVQHAEWMWTQHQLLRRHGLGNFKQFVKDITVDVAMLWYLNGLENQKTEHGAAINENYARELMELYTMGILDGKGAPNYTQHDVREAARSLTGWKVKPGQDDHHASLESAFYPWYWDGGDKTFLGQTGKWKALDVVEIIFRERAGAVAHFICRKLYRWFVAAEGEDTSESEVIIAQMAKIFIASDWEIEPVVRELLTSEEFFMQDNIGCLPKNGIELLVGMLRTFAITDVPDFQKTRTLAERWNQNDMLLRMESLGHWLCFPPSVAGWGDGRGWLTSSSLAVRLKYATRIMNGTMLFRDDGYPCFTFDPIGFAKQFSGAAHPKELVVAMATALWSIPPDEGETAILLESLLDGGIDYEWSLDDAAQHPESRLRKCLAQLVSMPKFQLL